MKFRLAQSKIQFFVLSLFTVLFVIIIFFSLKISRHFSKTMIQSFQQDQLYLVRTAAAGMQQIIDHLNEDIAHLSTIDALRQEVPEAYTALVKDVYRIFAGKVDSIYIIDKNKQVQYVYPFVQKEIGKDLGSIHYLNDVFKNKKPTIGPCFLRADGTYVLAINYPVFQDESNERVMRVLCCIIRMDMLTGSLLPIMNMRDRGIFWIIDQDGLIIYHPDPSLLLKGYAHIQGNSREKENNRNTAGQVNPFPAMKKGLEAWGIYPFWGKNQELYAFTPLQIDSSKWLIGITTPYTSLYSPIKNNNRNMFFLTLAIFSIFALGGYLLHCSNKKRSLLETETEFLKKKVELEGEIKMERDRLHNLFNSMADAVIVINADYQVEFMNREAISRFGDQVGTPCFKGLCGYDPPRSACPLTYIESSSFEGTLMHYHDTRRNRWYEISVAPLVKTWPKKSIVEIVRDVTEEKELEEKLQASEKKYRTLVNHTGDLIMMQDLQGTVLFVSESIENLLGYQVDEFCYKPFRQFLTENPVNDPWRKEISGQGDLQRRLRPHLLECKTKRGDKVLLEANESEVFDRHGQEKQIMGVYRDITERKRLEEQLLESERLRMASLTKRFRFREIIGRNPKMQEIYELIETVSQSKATVLILGESGTGKELVARAVHYQGLLADGPFVGISCSVLSENLLESELFGHVRGAFTGAVRDKTGRFELANGGTLFLDEIGDMSLNIQTKLLRVLQEREFEKVGGEKTVKVDVRIIAATNKDLKEEVAQGRFREDLYYRLNVVEIKLPSLGERMDDLPLLVTYFVEKFNQETGKKIEGLSREAMRILSRYSWPGNIRELEHVIEHAFVTCNKSSIQAWHLPKDLLGNKTGDIIKSGVKRGLSKDQIEKGILINTLEECDWNLILVMQKLNISRPTLWRRMKKFELSKKK